jgi:N-acetylglucosaminyl-diphospho-decaprenol L-rhamnosyltransferase
MDISIVIVNYNVKDYLLECLKSIYSNTFKDVEVIVVDNASVDGSMEEVQKRFPEVKIIKNHENLGFPAANNQAFRIVKGKYIFMLNPDAEMFDDTLAQLKQFMEENPDIALVAPQLLNTDGTVQQSVWRFPTIRSIFGEMFYLPPLLKRKNYADYDLGVAFDAESLSGAALFFRRTMMDSIGMLDENLFWIEDIDFCYRAQKAGLRVVYFPGARAVHHISVSARKNYKVSLSNQNFNKIKFYRKHHSHLATAIVIWLSLYHVFAKLVIFSLLSPFSPMWHGKAKAYAYTLKHIFNPPTKLV